jgi:hypothetical protein
MRSLSTAVFFLLFLKLKVRAIALSIYKETKVSKRLGENGREEEGEFEPVHLAGTALAAAIHHE